MPRSGAPLSRSFQELFKDTLTVKVLTAGPVDPNTDAPTGAGTSVLIISQLGSDQDVLPGKRFRNEINSGVQGTPPVSIFLTPYFQLPALQPGQVFQYEVNGRVRPLMRQGPPQDAAGQGLLMELELGAPQS